VIQVLFILLCCGFFFQSGVGTNLNFMRKIGKDLKSNDLENEIKFESHLEYGDVNTIH
jgi:hypothetical protein